MKTLNVAVGDFGNLLGLVGTMITFVRNGWDVYLYMDLTRKGHKILGGSDVKNMLTDAGVHLRRHGPEDAVPERADLTLTGMSASDGEFSLERCFLRAYPDCFTLAEIQGLWNHPEWQQALPLIGHLFTTHEPDAELLIATPCTIISPPQIATFQLRLGQIQETEEKVRALLNIPKVRPVVVWIGIPHECSSDALHLLGMACAGACTRPKLVVVRHYRATDHERHQQVIGDVPSTVSVIDASPISFGHYDPELVDEIHVPEVLMSDTQPISLPELMVLGREGLIVGSESNDVLVNCPATGFASALFLPHRIQQFLLGEKGRTIFNTCVPQACTIGHMQMIIDGMLSNSVARRKHCFEVQESFRFSDPAQHIFETMTSNT